MGNPAPGTKAYDRKLAATQRRKTMQRHTKFLKQPRVKKAMALVRAKAAEESDALRRRSNCHMVRASTAEKKAALLQKQNDDLQAEVTRLRSKVRVRDSLEEDLKHARAQLNRWLLFWGWVKAHSREGTLRWLERLWTKGPKRSPDGCWGGGQ
jgi:hypothetical protein